MHDRAADSAGHDYVEITLQGSDEKSRLTFIPAKDAGYGSDSVRINRVQSNGNVVNYGPEIPIVSIPDLLCALFDLTKRIAYKMGEENAAIEHLLGK